MFLGDFMQYIMYTNLLREVVKWLLHLQHQRSQQLWRVKVARPLKKTALGNWQLELWERVGKQAPSAEKIRVQGAQWYLYRSAGSGNPNPQFRFQKKKAKTWEWWKDREGTKESVPLWNLSNQNRNQRTWRRCSTPKPTTLKQLEKAQGSKRSIL